MEKSFGILETKGFAPAISAAENILKDNKIDLIKVEKSGGGIISLFFKGEIESLKAAFEKGIEHARLVGEIVNLYVVVHTNDKLEKIFFDDNNLSKITSLQAKNIANEKVPAKDKTDKVKTGILKQDKPLKKHSTETKKIDSPKILDSISTIQRLRREALASEKFSKKKQASLNKNEEKPQAVLNLSKIENLNVHELRQLARSTKSFPIQGREISKANRKELVNYFKEIA